MASFCYVVGKAVGLIFSFTQSTDTMAQAGSGGTGAAAAEQLTEAAEVTGAAAFFMVRNTAAAQANGGAPLPVIGNTAAVVPAAAAPVAVILAGPVIANIAVPLVRLGGMQLMFDIDAVILGSLPKKSNPCCEIHAWIDEA